MTAATNNGAAPAHFSSLPPELRLHIYDLVFISILDPNISLEDLKACPPTPSVTRVSCMLRDEALPAWRKALNDALDSHDIMDQTLYAAYVVAQDNVSCPYWMRQRATAAARRQCRCAMVEYDAHAERLKALRELEEAISHWSEEGGLDGERS